MIDKELMDAAMEAGKLFGRFSYLEKCYFSHEGGFMHWLSRKRAGSDNPPPDGMARVYTEIQQACAAELERLAETDGNAETYTARRRAIRDAASMIKDDGLKRHRVAKRRSIILRDIRGGNANG